VVRYSVGLFGFSLIFAVMSLNRLEKDTVPGARGGLYRAARDHVHGVVPVPHRPCSALAAARQHRGA
jgi:hypothetical protein